MDDDTLKKFAYISISDYRIRTMKSLRNEIKTPSKIANDTGIRKNHISKVLADLKKIGVAECINEEAYRGRIYRLTQEGNEVMDMIESNEPEK